VAVTSRIGAVHLGWNVLAIAAGGGGIDIRPLPVEGTFTPPAYLLADAAGRLHTGGDAATRAIAGRQGLGLAVADVREVIGFPEIVVAGARWPAPAVFRARLFNPLTEIAWYLGATDLVVLPYPHDWSDEKVDSYCDLVSTLGVEVAPLQESVALASYVRATESTADGEMPVGVTAVYCDGRSALVVAVHGDRDRPTESVDVPVAASATTDPRVADRLVYDVLAAARSVQAETKLVVLTGAACFNDSIRPAFRNSLGRRLRVAGHPMHAMALGAVELLHREEEADEAASEPSGGNDGARPQVERSRTRPNPSEFGFGLYQRNHMRVSPD